MNEKKFVSSILEKPTPLSPDQKKVVLSSSRYLRIVAGAGTGKTETMTRRIAYLLIAKKIEPKNIVAFTFTERAAQSMKSRIYERVKQLHGEEACAKLGEMFIGTIHGFCMRLLEDKFGFGDHTPLDENESAAFLFRIGWELGLGKNGNYIHNCLTFLKSVDVFYNELINREALEKEAPDFSKKLSKYENRLSEHRLLTFGQMIAFAVEKIEQHPESISHIKHLIVDEYQDINRAQEKLIRLIGKKASVFVVGDPRQCIYQWRGSDEKCFDDFSKIFPNVETVQIRDNWRSGSIIVRSANSLANSFKKQNYEPLSHKRSIKGGSFLTIFKNSQEEAKWITNQIKTLVQRRKVCQYKDIAILLRSVKTSGNNFIKNFKDENIPFILGGKIGLFGRDEARAMAMFFCWLNDGGFWRGGLSYSQEIRGNNLLREGLKAWKSAVDSSLVPKNVEKNLKSWKSKVIQGDYSNFTRIYQDILVHLGFLNLDPDNELHAPIIANLGRFNQLLTDYEASVRRGGTKPDWKNHLKGLMWYLNAFAQSSYEEQPAEDIRGLNAVLIMTVHQAKGLEWPVVFVPCLTDSRFPSSNTGKLQEWFIPRNSNLFDVERYEGDYEDEKRLFYVAITRARDIICTSFFLHVNPESSRRQKPSRFLKTISHKARKIKLSQNIPDEISIMPTSAKDELQTFSASEILTFRKCPNLYRLRNLWGFQAELDIALGFGNSLHYCLRCASELIKQGEDPIKAIKIVAEKFHLPFAGGKPFEQMRKAAKKILIRFVSRHKEDMLKIHEVESRLEFPLERATIAGKVDVIIHKDKNGKKIEVRDYKTADTVTTLEESSLQLRIYSLGLRKIKQPVETASIAYLKQEKDSKNDLEYVTVNELALQQAEKVAKQCIEKIKKSQFKGKPSKNCKSCDFFKICKWANKK